MKGALAITLILVSIMVSNMVNGGKNTMNNSAGNQQEYVFQFDDLEKQRDDSGRSYLQFLDVDSMHCGIYHLKAGEKDPQQPHDDDEVYYVQSGKAKFTYGDQSSDVGPGSVLFVPAKMEHRFHDIEEDITLLVFFARSR